MSPGRVCFHSPEEIMKIEPFMFQDGSIMTSLGDLDNSRRDSILQTRITFQNHSLNHYSLKDFKELPRAALDPIKVWKTAFTDSQPGNSVADIIDNIEKVEANNCYFLPEEKLVIVLSQEHIHAVSLLTKRRMATKFMFNDVTTCVAVPQSSEGIVFLNIWIT